MPLPPLPMTIPGRAVKTMTFALFAARSTSTRGDVGVHQVVLDGTLDADVLVEPLGVGLVLEPLRVPGLDDAEAEAVRMNFLTHDFDSPEAEPCLALAEDDGDVAHALLDTGRATHRAGAPAAHVLVRGLVDERRLDEEGVEVDAGLCVRALATALSMTFLRTGAPLFRVNSRSCSASPA